jgi:hypothetical protein
MIQIRLDIPTDAIALFCALANRGTALFDSVLIGAAAWGLLDHIQTQQEQAAMLRRPSTSSASGRWCRVRTLSATRGDPH